MDANKNYKDFPWQRVIFSLSPSRIKVKFSSTFEKKMTELAKADALRLHRHLAEQAT